MSVKRMKMYYTINPQNLILGMPPIFGHSAQIQISKEHERMSQGISPVGYLDDHGRFYSAHWICVNNRCRYYFKIKLNDEQYNRMQRNPAVFDQKCPKCSSIYEFRAYEDTDEDRDGFYLKFLNK